MHAITNSHDTSTEVHYGAIHEHLPGITKVRLYNVR